MLYPVELWLLVQRRGRDSNPRYSFWPYNSLANCRLRPLGHLSRSIVDLSIALHPSLPYSVFNPFSVSEAAAEEEGFEPPALACDGFQDRCLKPFGHSSRQPRRLKPMKYRNKLASVKGFFRSELGARTQLGKAGIRP